MVSFIAPQMVWIDCRGRQYKLLQDKFTGSVSIKVHRGIKDINTVIGSNIYVRSSDDLSERVSMGNLNKEQCTRVLQLFQQVIDQKTVLTDEFRVRDGCASTVKHGPSGKLLNLVKEVTLIFPREKYEQVLKPDA